MRITKRRVLFIAASAAFLIILVWMAVLGALSGGQAALAFAFWVGTGSLYYLGRSLRLLRSDTQRRMDRTERILQKGLRRQGATSHADFDATRQLLDSVHQQTLARLARLELAVDEAIINIRQSGDLLLERIDERGSITEQLIESTVGLQLAIGDQPLPPMRGWAGFADLQCYLYRLVRATGPELVVECGSGVSTVVVAAALAKNGHGSLVSLDHDEWYANRTRSWLETRGLDRHAEVLNAPLSRNALVPSSAWYKHSWLEEDERGIDLLVVDGPPGSTGERARYPAVPVLKERLVENCIIVLDDVKREDEYDILHAWQDLLPSHTSLILSHVKGTGVLFPADRRSVAQWLD